MKNKLALTFLLIVGLSQMVGDILHLPALKGIGAATGASPAPKVFTAHQGFETYSSNFYLDWDDENGIRQSLFLTPQVYNGVKGPYNRRNAYGAAFSYTPVLYENTLTRPMFESVVQHALCGKSSILHELGMKKILPLLMYVRLEPRQKLPEGNKWKLQHEVICNGK